MAKKQVEKVKPPKDEPKAKGAKASKTAKSYAKEAGAAAAREAKAAKSSAKSDSRSVAKGGKAAKVAAPGPGGVVASAKRKAKAAALSLPDVSSPVAAASAKAGKAVRSADATALGLVPAVPKLSSPDIDVKGTARDLGNRIMAVLDTPAGRVIAAELLVYVAGALTKAAAQSETGRDVKDGVTKAGARIGAAAAEAGAKLVESGTQAAGAGADAVSEAAYSAKDLMREVAQVAVSAVGGVVADTAAKVAKRRGRKTENGKTESLPANPPGVVPA